MDEKLYKLSLNIERKFGVATPIQAWKREPRVFKFVHIVIHFHPRHRRLCSLPNGFLAFVSTVLQNLTIIVGFPMIQITLSSCLLRVFAFSQPISGKVKSLYICNCYKPEVLQCLCWRLALVWFQSPRFSTLLWLYSFLIGPSAATWPISAEPTAFDDLDPVWNCDNERHG